MAELELLMSRIQNPQINRSAEILFQVCTLLTKREVEDHEVDDGISLALEICHGIQYQAGTEILRILGVEQKPGDFEKPDQTQSSAPGSDPLNAD